MLLRLTSRPRWQHSRAEARPASASPTFSNVARNWLAGRVTLGQPVDLFGEAAHRAVGLLADEQPHRQHDHDLSSTYSQIGKVAPVTPVHPCRRLATAGACGCPL
jgi:hypothetical protein